MQTSIETKGSDSETRPKAIDYCVWQYRGMTFGFVGELMNSWSMLRNLGWDLLEKSYAPNIRLAFDLYFGQRKNVFISIFPTGNDDVGL